MLVACVVTILPSLMLCSCDRRASTPSPLSNSQPAEENQASEHSELTNLATTPEAQISRRAFQSPAVTDDVTGWSVEVFNQTATTKLKRLKKALESSSRLSIRSVNFLISDDFRCTDLTAAVDVKSPVDGLHVARRTMPSTNATHAGAAGFVNALRALFPSTQSDVLRRIDFKIVSVKKSGNEILARAKVEIALLSESSREQISSTWKTVWTTARQPAALKEIYLEEEERVSATSLTFQDCTQRVLGNTQSFRRQLAFGVDHWLEQIEQRYGISSSGWQGLAVGDVNGDGLDDVYLCQPGGLPNRLYVQNRDGTARDTSSHAGVDWWDHSHAALLADLDNDADQDLIVATALGLIFMSNNGQGEFQLETVKSCPEAMPFTICAADYDDDGDLDIYVSCYSPRGNAIKTHFLGRPVPYHDANNGGRNCLFRNDLKWSYSNVTKQVGLDQNNRRFSLAAAWEDYDNDGDQDLYVANDYGRNNLFRNDNGHFVDVAKQAGVEDISAGMSVSWGDYNQDGNMDLYVSNMWSAAGHRIAYQRQFQPDAAMGMRSDIQRHARGNSLFQNCGDGTFRDVSELCQVTMGRWAWGSRFVDLNNDSWLDLFVTNGFITQEDTDDL